jgi:hypothetical protein
VGNLFKDLTSGFSSFVLSWLVPSAVVVSLFSLFDYPSIVNGQPQSHTKGQPPPETWVSPLRSFVSSGALAATAAFALAVVVLALVTSLASRPLYRLLEGYTLPKAIKRPMLIRQHRRYRRLRIAASRHRTSQVAAHGLIQEELANYPTQTRRIMPTRLGNALKAMETYGTDRYRLDSQTLWYEVYSSAPERCRTDADQARASVDFFISLVGLLALLSAASVASAVTTDASQCWVVALGAAAATRPAYTTANKNMTDWRFAVQALVNLSRPELAKGLGYRLPKTFASERAFWSAWTKFVARGHRDLLVGFDECRVGYDDEIGGAAAS